MTDEQYAAAARRYRRRQLSLAIIWALLSGAYIAGFGTDSGTFRWVMGIGFAICAVLSAFASRRGLPDTRRKDSGAPQ